MTVAICKGQTKDGKPCSARPRPGTDLCPWHSPDLAEQRAEWSRRGGRNSSNKQRARKSLPAELMTIEELSAFLGTVFKGVISGKVEPGVATAAATVARTMGELAKVSTFESDLAELRTQLSIVRRRGA